MSAQLDLSIRSTGIGSSEIGAIVGVSPFSTPLDVYISKVYGPKQRKSTPNQRWGLLHEHAMAIAYTEDTGIELEGDGRTTVRHPEHEVILDTVDRLAVGHSIVVDFKTAQRFTPLEYGETNWDYRIWEASLDAPTDETHLIPQCIQAQGAIHMAVHDRDRFDLPLLIDGFYWRIFTMARDAELEGYLIEAAERFWRDHVIPRKPPAAENEEKRAELLKHLYPRHVDEVPLPSSGWFDSIALELRDTRLELKRLAQIEARLVNDCKEAIGDACGIAGAWCRIDWKANKNGVRSFTPRFIKEEV
jgi:predicted phage-related endonuclease